MTPSARLTPEDESVYGRLKARMAEVAPESLPDLETAFRALLSMAAERHKLYEKVDALRAEVARLTEENMALKARMRPRRRKAEPFYATED